LGLIGIDYNVALGFALLAFSTFVYDTLDVATRLGRYVFQELVGWKTKSSQYAATLITLIIPFIFLMVTDPTKKAYMVAWPIFGTSNQLLASLTLMAVSVWLIRTGKNPIISIIPMFFMLTMTLWSLIIQGLPGWRLLFSGGLMETPILIVMISTTVLFILAIGLLTESARLLILKKCK
jgi:carbon starvation protein